MNLYFLLFSGLAAVVFGVSLAKTEIGTGAKVAITVLAGLLFGWIEWMAMPTLAWGYYGIPFFFLLTGGIAWLITGLREETSKFAVWTTLISFVFLTIIPLVTSWSAFHSGSYYRLLGEVTESEFSEAVSPIDIRHC